MDELNLSSPQFLIFLHEYKTFIELLPIFIYGAVAGVASYLNGHEDRANFAKIIRVVLFNSILCATIYGFGREFGLSYLASISLGAFVSLMGLDKTIDVGDKLFSLVGNAVKGKDDKNKDAKG